MIKEGAKRPSLRAQRSDRGRNVRGSAVSSANGQSKVQIIVLPQGEWEPLARTFGSDRGRNVRATKGSPLGEKCRELRERRT